MGGGKSYALHCSRLCRFRCSSTGAAFSCSYPHPADTGLCRFCVALHPRRKAAHIDQHFTPALDAAHCAGLAQLPNAIHGNAGRCGSLLNGCHSWKFNRHYFASPPNRFSISSTAAIIRAFSAGDSSIRNFLERVLSVMPSVAANCQSVKPRPATAFRISVFVCRKKITSFNFVRCSFHRA